MFSSIATAPAKQSVGETITVLSGRLSSATLLEDRRAAILGLRSFAKEYPASVASGALRSLIESLSKDAEDPETVKSVLETLLMLFNPNQNSPEASEDIALWLADEFTQRDHVTLLLDFLETLDAHVRLYSMQLISAIHSARTDRTEDCVLAAPGGLSKLVTVLDDRREAVRNEALSLLTYLTASSPTIQQIVAFESAFERAFAIIAAEGSLVEGERVVEDCLIFVANLLRLHPKNQALFRESGYVQQLSKLLESTYQARDPEEELAQWAQEQRGRNTYALLAVLRLFLVPGAEGTLKNQAAFWQHGVLYHALQLAFDHGSQLPIKAEALTACSDIILGHPKLQEGFAQLQVPSVFETPQAPTNGNTAKPKAVPMVYVIDGLLDLVLGLPVLQAFDLRYAACQCIKAYFHNHPEIRLHFLRRAIEGHSSGADETANVLTTLLQPLDNTASLDPYRFWFAAVITFHLIFENVEGKALAMAVTEGDAESGEEVVTSIQTVTAHLLSALSRADDERIVIGYLMLLVGWLFEDLDGVNDFLNEGGYITTLATIVNPARQDPTQSALVQGLCAALLGVVYEFSTKDSPVSRSTLHTVLLEKVGRDKYVDTLTKFRSQPFVRDFEVIPAKLGNSGELPEVFFDAQFVDFFKDNYSRLVKAIDREPGLEISVVTNGVEKGVSRELVDSLRAQLAEKDRALQDAVDESAALEAKLSVEQVENRKTKELNATEMARIRNINEAMQRHHDEDIRNLEAQQKLKEEALQKQLDAIRAEMEAKAEMALKAQRKKEIDLQKEIDGLRRSLEAEKAQIRQQVDAERVQLQKQADAEKAELQRQLDYKLETAETDSVRAKRRVEAEIADLKATISRLEVDLMKANKAKTQEVKAAQDKGSADLASQEKKAKSFEQKIKDLEAKLKKAEEKTKVSDKQIEELENDLAKKAEESSKFTKQLKEKDDEKAATQTELDDLLMVFSDLEEKVEKYKQRLLEAGGTVSDADDGSDDEDDEDDEDDDEVD
ncbi:p115 like vesicle tethering protein [Microdochium trichocladiopsis]|uniref:P115 like vesicle tethering protein n=1 Tax=Microdochium trichocladiopsis TaxID=1682393 RepID=A0A9P8YGH3_9PEZI|nr:p115 like vesicle tethering protein [Microdochium trichocladiopsis]KAH7040086.1 p115 like vesicle tethering protein [Microdochium trichocladiopsis]